MSHITLEQRYEIQAMIINAGFLQKEIAKTIGKSESAISCELKRNKDRRSGKYIASTAQKKYEKRQKEKPKSKRFTKEIKKTVEQFLQKKFSPEQITVRLKSLGQFWVSHERIYLHIWEDKKNGEKLYTHLRRQGKKYNKHDNKKAGRGLIPNRIGISKRPKIVDQKTRFGDLRSSVFKVATELARNRVAQILGIC